MRFWFAHWTVGGSKVDRRNERAYGPILFTLYTFRNSALKLSAQFPPVGNSSRRAMLCVLENGTSQLIAIAEIDPDPGMLAFGCRHGTRHAIVTGTVGRDTVDEPDITIGLLTGIWDFGFAHSDFVKHLGVTRLPPVAGPVRNMKVSRMTRPAKLVRIRLENPRRLHREDHQLSSDRPSSHAPCRCRAPGSELAAPHRNRQAQHLSATLSLREGRQRLAAPVGISRCLFVPLFFFMCESSFG